MSSQSGWYPDPSGAPGQFRYWDGQRWSQETTSNLAAPAPGGPSPGGARPGGRPRHRGGRGLLIGGVALLVVIIVAGVFVVRGLLGPDDRIAGPLPSSTVSGWDDSSPIPSDSPTPTPTPTPSDSAQPKPMKECPFGNPSTPADHREDGRVHGGELSYQPAPGEWGNVIPMPQITWSYDASGQQLTTEPGWFAMLVVAQLHQDDGFIEPRQAAEGVTQCATTSGFYAGLTGTKTLSSKKVTVDGKPGWAIRTDVNVDRENLSVPGDVLQVVVVDTGNPAGLSMFLGAVSIGDDARAKALDAAVSSLKVG